ncbi:unnamed protein product [Sphagnum troendelagicum]|uniref:Dienelactone hydrolase domain-containing protein n=1 Tax=Sphagnum troendelagicum TaxID=128251 RepID=A0ABP0TE58_9BRYO
MASVIFAPSSPVASLYGARQAPGATALTRMSCGYSPLPRSLGREEEEHSRPPLVLFLISGFWMGGGLSIASPVRVPGIDALVAFYGAPPPQLPDPVEAKVPVQAQFGKITP